MFLANLLQLLPIVSHDLRFPSCLASPKSVHQTGGLSPDVAYPFNMAPKVSTSFTAAQSPTDLHCLTGMNWSISAWSRRHDRRNVVAQSLYQTRFGVCRNESVPAGAAEYVKRKLRNIRLTASTSS